MKHVIKEIQSLGDITQGIDQIHILPILKAEKSLSKEYNHFEKAQDIANCMEKLGYKYRVGGEDENYYADDLGRNLLGRPIWYEPKKEAPKSPPKLQV